MYDVCFVIGVGPLVPPLSDAGTEVALARFARSPASATRLGSFTPALPSNIPLEVNTNDFANGWQGSDRRPRAEASHCHYHRRPRPWRQWSWLVCKLRCRRELV